MLVCYSRIFFPEEVELIQSIPLSCNPHTDHQIWFFTKNGKYYVRSGYQVAVQKKTNNLNSGVGGSNGAQMALYWKLIWSLHNRNKIKHLLWGAFHDILPTCVNLESKKVIPSGICFACGKSNEFLIHALWECKKKIS